MRCSRTPESKIPTGGCHVRPSADHAGPRHCCSRSCRRTPPAPPASPPRRPIRLTPAEADTLTQAILKDRADTEQWLKSGATSYLATVQRVDFGAKQTLTVGRAPDNDVCIADPSVAAHHLRVTVSGDSFRVAALDPGATFQVKDECCATPPGPERHRHRALHAAPVAPALPGHHRLRPAEPALRAVQGAQVVPGGPLLPLPAAAHAEPEAGHGRSSSRPAGTGGARCAWAGSTSWSARRAAGSRPRGCWSRAWARTTSRSSSATPPPARRAIRTGRYVDPVRLPDGRYLLDFNLCYNPACAVSEHYNCPIPPKANVLKVRDPRGRDGRALSLAGGFVPLLSLVATALLLASPPAAADSTATAARATPSRRRGRAARVHELPRLPDRPTTTTCAPTSLSWTTCAIRRTPTCRSSRPRRTPAAAASRSRSRSWARGASPAWATRCAASPGPATATRWCAAPSRRSASSGSCASPRARRSPDGSPSPTPSRGRRGPASGGPLAQLGLHHQPERLDQRPELHALLEHLGLAHGQPRPENDKSTFSVSGSYYENRFDLDDGERIPSVSRSRARAPARCWGFGEHWSAAARASAYPSTYSNIKLDWVAGPSLEFNAFPYSQSTRRQLRFDYYLTFHRADYVQPDHLLQDAREPVAPGASRWCSRAGSRGLGRSRSRASTTSTTSGRTC